MAPHIRLRRSRTAPIVFEHDAAGWGPDLAHDRPAGRGTTAEYGSFPASLWPQLQGGVISGRAADGTTVAVSTQQAGWRQRCVDLGLADLIDIPL